MICHWEPLLCVIDFKYSFTNFNLSNLCPYHHIPISFRINAKYTQSTVERLFVTEILLEVNSSLHYIKNRKTLQIDVSNIAWYGNMLTRTNILNIYTYLFSEISGRKIDVPMIWGKCNIKIMVYITLRAQLGNSIGCSTPSSAKKHMWAHMSSKLVLL